MNAPHAGVPAAQDSPGAWLEPLAGHWIDIARARLRHAAPLVRVTLVALRGSAPREPGATMLVDRRTTQGTIGGGRLEWRATAAARALLNDAAAPAVRLEDLVLGPQLGQCCGGRVELWLERLTREDLPWLGAAARRLRDGSGHALATECSERGVSRRMLRAVPGAAAPTFRRQTPTRAVLIESLVLHRPRLWVFGAGHVGQALVRMMAELAVFDLTWIDPRAALLPPGLPAGVNSRVCANPLEQLREAPGGTRFVVLTHDHALDYELCRAVLLRGDSAWLGLIGSASKAARFRSRLLRDGLDRGRLSGLTCPIGIDGISSKLPGAIAIAIAAQLLRLPSSAEPCALVEPAEAHDLAEPPRSAQPPGCGGCESCGGRRGFEP